MQKLSFGKANIEYGYLPQAHTDGDIYIYFRDANVLLAGDVVAVGPLSDPGLLNRRLVPGHGQRHQAAAGSGG
ncbi:MAG: hypothetical protein WDM77_10745 [Steroidobacteraceae bacterium]